MGCRGNGQTHFGDWRYLLVCFSCVLIAQVFSICLVTRLMTSGDQRDDFMMRDICANDLRLEMAHLSQCGYVHER